MEINKTEERKNAYKIVISDLGISPFRVIRVAFALIGLIPLLVIFYVIVGRHFLYKLFLGNDGLVIITAVFISIIGFLYAYNLVDKMIIRLISYSYERKRADDAKTELVTSIAHDLRTPLTVIKIALSNLADGVGGALNKAHSKITATCINGVNRLIDFVNEIIKISKAGDLRTEIKRELVNFEEMVKNEVNEFSELTKKNNQNIEYKVETSNSKLWGDKTKLSRAVINLLSNAIKYSPPGGKIDVVLSGDEGTVRLAVINTGSEIPPDEKDKIFSKYERLAKHSGIEGTGLGLSIVKDIIDLHMGRLTVKSQPGKQTEFTIVLPKDLRTEGR